MTTTTGVSQPRARSAAEQVEAVDVGQPEVEQDDVRSPGVLGLGPIERLGARRDPVDSKARGIETSPQERGDAHLVLDEEHPHRGISTQNVAPCPGRLSTPAIPP